MDQIDLFQMADARSLLGELLQSSRLYRESADYLALLDFVVKLPNFAPFNAMLLQVQKPGLRFAASARDWSQRFNRRIKEGSRPLLILWPFGPVALVYDLDDTEGPELPTDVAHAFRAFGSITKYQLDGFIATLARRGITLKRIPAGDASAGRIVIVRPSFDAKIKPEYKITINSEHDPNVQFATLVHELGHLFLGHLGPDKFLKIQDRRGLSHGEVELEAESVSYMVCKRHGIYTESEKYLADFVEVHKSIDALDIYSILKAAGQVETALDITVHTQF